MSTQFSHSDILPPKLRYKFASKLEHASNSEGSPSPVALSKVPVSLAMNDSFKMSYPKECKGALMASFEDGAKQKWVPSSKGKTKKGSYFSSKRKAGAVDVENADWTDKVPLCPTYRPSKEEFEDPMAYFQKIAPEASQFGICKIVSPLSPTVPTAVVLKNKMKPGKFAAEYLPLQMGYREISYDTHRNYNIQDFEKMANEFYVRKYKVAAQQPPGLVEKDFWMRLSQKNTGRVEYVKDLEASGFSSDPRDPLGTSKWNLKKFPHLPQSALRLLEQRIWGVTDPLIYMGMLFSYIYWHTEPAHLYHIDYHHCGSPRTWYGSPTSAAYAFERAVKEFVFPGEGLEAYEAYDVLNLKALLFSPSVMLKHNIPVFKTVQYPGEFIITFPRVYHMGFSHGFSCWEAVNFATPEWFLFGDEASDRCALYNRPQIVPYQELLCKEAMYLLSNKKSKLKSPSYRDLKVSFTCLIRLHHFACAEIKTKGGAQVSIIPSGIDTLSCRLCGRECHLAYVTCKCYPDPICIFHDIYDECPCKGSRLMAVREEILEMQNVAKRLESEDEELLKEVEALIRIKSEAFGCSSSMTTNSELDELISIQPKRQTVSQLIPKKLRIQYQ